jgi:membrane protein implicated in regulation of membrane protease activity
MTYEDPDLGPVRSALTLRLWLAGFGLVFCGVAAVITGFTGPAWLAVAFAGLAAIAVVDIAVIAARKRRGEPG